MSNIPTNGTSKIWQWIAGTAVSVLILMLGYMATRVDTQLTEIRSETKSISTELSNIKTSQAVIEYRVNKLEGERK